jgi:GxxExxY protein
MPPTPQFNDPQTYTILGAAMAVHRQLGNGFSEAVYSEAFAQALAARRIPFAAEAFLPVVYNGQRLSTSFRADFVCYKQVIVEIKALASVAGPAHAQVLNYLKASGLERGLLINFGAARLEWRRFIWTRHRERQ